ncbi:MFS family permease [Methanolinea mesophila]|uniref:MFS transporter n=1 Tax=Methanolinea mesophila TaxID=547055 RepID=UPI001AE59345|nr:MFS family permease [Methanolinea mesophila]
MAESLRRGPFYILLVAVFLGMLGLGIVLPLLPVFVEEFNASPFWVGALFAGYGLSRIIFTPSIGSLSDKYGRKWFITGGLGLYTLVSIWYIFPGSIYELFVIRFIHGIASALISSVAMSYVGDLTPKGQEGLYQGRLSNVFYLGMGSGPIIGGAIYSVAGFTPVFIVMAIMSFIPFLLCIRMLPESKPEFRTPPKLWSAFCHPRMQANLFFRFMNTFAYSAFMVFIPVLAATQYGYSTTLTGLVIAFEVFSMAISLGYFGKMADSGRYKRSHMIVIGTLLVSFGTLALIFVKFLPVVGIVAILIGVGNAIAIVAATAVVAIDGRELGQGVVMGAFNTAMSIGIVVPPLIFGVILTFWGIDAVFLIAGLITLASLPFFWWLVLRSRKWFATRAAACEPGS